MSRRLTGTAMRIYDLSTLPYGTPDALVVTGVPAMRCVAAETASSSDSPWSTPWDRWRAARTPGGWWYDPNLQLAFQAHARQRRTGYMGHEALLGAGAYSTGGGGVVLEQRYGAVLLSHLLTRTPVPGLGDAVTPGEVRFQAKAVTAVDDFLVSGDAPNGARHRLSVAVRRSPRLVPSELQSVQLISGYLATLADRWPLLRSRRWHLALAVAPLCLPAHQLKELAFEAVAAGSNAQFRIRLTQQGRPNAKIRGRLIQLDAVVQAALDQGAPSGDVAPAELTWRLLSCLSLAELRLEGADRSDRTHAVARLQQATPENLVADGDTLFARLVELAGSYAPSGAAVDLATLQADLRDLQCVRDTDVPATSADSPTAAKAASAGHRSSAATGRRREARVDKGRLPKQRWAAERKLMPEAGQPQFCEGTLVVRDRYMLHAFDAANGGKLWAVQTAFNGRPALGNGAVFTTDRTGNLLPRDLRVGNKRAPLSARLRDGLAVYDRGTLYGPDPDGKLHALDTATGSCLWTAPNEDCVDAIPPQITIDTVFAILRGTPAPHDLSPGPGSAVLALDSATGRPIWPYPAQTPRIQQWTATDQAVYVVHRLGAEDRFAAFDASTGRLLWEHSLPAGAPTAPVVTDDTVFLTSAGNVYAMQVGTGRVLWAKRLDGRATAVPVASHGLIYVGSWNPHRLFALDARTGVPVWSKPGSGAFASAPIVVDSTVWAANRAGVLQGWDVTTGRRQGARYENLLWDPALQGEPAVQDGILYVTTLRGDLRCLSLR